MAWFKVDDGFHSHPKVLASEPAALGLWVVAGSWSGAHLTDGFVPDYALTRLLPGAAELAEKLVAVGLWRRAKGGYRFHDWADCNPSAVRVETEREAARQRMRKLRQKRRAKPETAGHAQDCSGEQPANVRELFAVGSQPRPDPYTELPTEVPTETQETSSPSSQRARAPKAKKGTRIPDDFAVTDDMVAWARQETPLVGAKETAAFVDYWRGVSGARGVKADWVATWRNWMRKAQTDAEARQPRTPSPGTPAGQSRNASILAAAMARAQAAEGAAQ